MSSSQKLGVSRDFTTLGSKQKKCASYAVQEGNENSVNSACSTPRLTKVEISIKRSTLCTSSRRVLVLGWGGTNNLQQSWSGSIDVS